MDQNEKKPQFGEIWLAKFDYEVPVSATESIIKSVEDTRFVLVLSKSSNYQEKYLRSVYVAPISFDIEFATHLDLLLPAEHNPLKVKCMAEFWNIMPALEFNLGEYEGKIENNEILKGIKSLWKMAFGLTDESTNLTGIHIGSFINTIRPLVRKFQEQEINETSFLQEPVLASLSLLEEEEIEAVKEQKIYKVIYKNEPSFIDNLLDILGLGKQAIKTYRGASQKLKLDFNEKSVELFNGIEVYSFTLTLQNIQNELYYLIFTGKHILSIQSVSIVVGNLIESLNEESTVNKDKRYFRLDKEFIKKIKNDFSIIINIENKIPIQLKFLISKKSPS